jgi:hypothetical protein
VKDPSVKILSTLCRQAEEGCTKRLEAILSRADPGDRALGRYLAEIVEAERDCLRRVERFDLEAPQPVPWNPDEKRTQDLVRRFFPSISQKLGEGPLLRDAALYFVECLEEENARFLLELSTRAPDEPSRTFFAELARSWESRQRNCREVLL